jgi:hypothetical protein
MEDERFDQLTKRLAAPVNRRQVLKLAAGTVAGGVLASLAGVRKAAAAPSPCAVFCGKTSFTGGPDHASCMQACNECGGNISNICRGPTGWICCQSGSTCCFGPTGALCCPPGTICLGNGQCGKPRNFCIPTCADTCSGTATGCLQACAAGTPGCACVSTTEGTPACVQEMCTFVVCTSSADCGAGSVCFTQGCCGP